MCHISRHRSHMDSPRIVLGHSQLKPASNRTAITTHDMTEFIKPRTENKNEIQ